MMDATLIIPQDELAVKENREIFLRYLEMYPGLHERDKAIYRKYLMYVILAMTALECPLDDAQKDEIKKA